MIGRKLEADAGPHDGVRRGGREPGGRNRGDKRPHRQSSRTATACAAVARRPASNAVTPAAQTSAAMTPKIVPTGQRVIMVQLNDCGLMTWISTCPSSAEHHARHRADQSEKRPRWRAFRLSAAW